ncbi:MAG: hypothetical protein ABIJ27_00100 [Candidatus Omnitrophota bacterium]
MKTKILCEVLAVTMIFSSLTFAATDEELFVGMGHRLGRGIKNVVGGWIEIPAQIGKGYSRGIYGKGDFKPAGAIIGVFRGVFHAVGRTASGAGDIISFWAMSPPDNQGVGIPLDAELAWEEGEQQSIFKPNVGEGLFKPVGNKLLRGAGYTVLGFTELPVQIKKGVENKAFDIGIIKGLWFWASRQIDGAIDLVTFPFPNPRDTEGLRFDQKWPMERSWW